MSTFSHPGWGFATALFSLAVTLAAVGGTAWPGHRSLGVVAFTRAAVLGVGGITVAVLVARDRPKSLQDLLVLKTDRVQEPVPGTPTSTRDILVLKVENASDVPLENLQVRLTGVMQRLTNGQSHTDSSFASHALLPLEQGSLPRLTPRDSLSFRVLKSDEATRPFARFEGLPEDPGNGFTGGTRTLQFSVRADGTRPLRAQFRVNYTPVGPTLQWDGT